MDKICLFMKMTCSEKCALFVNEHCNEGGECAIVSLQQSIHTLDYTLQGEYDRTPISRIADSLDELTALTELSDCVSKSAYGGKEFSVSASE